MTVSICFHAWQNVLTVWKNSFKELLVRKTFMIDFATTIHFPGCDQAQFGSVVLCSCAQLLKKTTNSFLASNSNYPTQFLTLSIKILLKLTKKIVKYLHCRSSLNKNLFEISKIAKKFRLSSHIFCWNAKNKEETAANNQTKATKHHFNPQIKKHKAPNHTRSQQSKKIQHLPKIPNTSPME